MFEDPLQFNQLHATLSYMPDSPLDDQDWHFDLEYKTLRWRFRYWHNDADFYDLFGPTERSRAGDALIIGYHRAFIYDPPRQLEFQHRMLAYYAGLDTLPAAQAVQTQFDTLTAFSSRAHLHQHHTIAGRRRSRTRLALESGACRRLRQRRDSSRASAAASIFGVPLPLRNSSVWLYTAAGGVGGETQQPAELLLLGRLRQQLRR